MSFLHSLIKYTLIKYLLWLEPLLDAENITVTMIFSTLNFIYCLMGEVDTFNVMREAIGEAKETGEIGQGPNHEMPNVIKLNMAYLHTM